MRVTIEELRSEIYGMLIKKVSDENANFIVENVVETAMRKGVRLDPVKNCLKDYKAFDKNKSILVSNKSASTINYDFQKQPVIPFMKEIIDNAVSKAKEMGIFMVGLSNSLGVHELDSWTVEVAKQNCIGIFTFNGGPYCTVPYGSAEPFFGTNPFSYGIPTETDPLLFDGATSEIALFDARNAVYNNTPLKTNSGLNKEGKLSTVAKDVFDPENETDCRLLPMGGGAKGSAIMLLLELITGLVGGKIGREASDVWKPDEFGGALIVIDPSKFGALDLFKARASKMLNEIRNSKPAHGFNSAKVPGDDSLERRKGCFRTNEVEIKDSVFEEIKNLSKK